MLCASRLCGVVVVDALGLDWLIIYVNCSFEVMGYHAEDVFGMLLAGTLSHMLSFQFVTH
jgi:hypothetical protein